MLTRYATAFAIVASLACAAVPSLRHQLLRVAGQALVADEQISKSDIIVVSSDSGGAGTLEAADLVRAGIAMRVAVFDDPPSGEDFEFIRRGLPYEDQGARQIRQLKALGIENIVSISRHADGTEAESQVFPAWCDQNQWRNVVVVAAKDHSRRLRRILDRVLTGHATHVAVRAEHYSGFDPDRWWQTRDGVRTEIVEMQKLILDFILHPSIAMTVPFPGDIA